MKEPIKVGYCVAYDWHLLEHSLPLIYEYADIICLSLDIERISWSGNVYPWDEDKFRKLISELDPQKKIITVEENYHLPELTPMQNEVRQRNLIAHHMGAGGWHVQLDCDEYFFGFSEFVKYLRSIPKKKANKINICCAWIHLYRQVEGGFLYIDPVSNNNLEFMQIATKDPHYEYSRRNGYFNIYTNFKIVHQSWARSPEEIQDKIQNWGHSNDFDKSAYFEMWNSITPSNYQQIKNFHPLKPEVWPGLKFIKCDSITDFPKKFENREVPVFTSAELAYKNSKFFSRMRSLFAKKN